MPPDCHFWIKVFRILSTRFMKFQDFVKFPFFWLTQRFRSCFFLNEFSAKSIIYRDFTEIWDSFIARQSSLLQLISYGIGLNVVLHLSFFLIIFDHQTESNWHRPRPKKIKKTSKKLSWSISVADLFQERLLLALQQQKLTDNFAGAKDAC